jgi:uncharacterized protein YdbL (DUF1318 family)
VRNLNRISNAFVLADLLGQAVAIAEEINEAADDTYGEIPDTKMALTEAIEEAKAVWKLYMRNNRRFYGP